MSLAADLIGAVPEPISLRIAHFPGGTIFPPQRAPWGKLLYAVSGVGEITISGQKFLSPPAYAIWIPPGVLHESRVPDDIDYASIYIRYDLCAELPTQPRTLVLSDLMRAIVSDFVARGVTVPASDDDRRLGQVLVDRLRLAPKHEQFLPLTEDVLLGPVLLALRSNPGDRRSLAEWARLMGTTERTLARHCNKSLGLSFKEWRRRLRLVTAFTQLKSGYPVRQVSAQLGYSNPSAFIAMFRRFTNLSPARLGR